jgi:hypothetical protein
MKTKLIFFILAIFLSSLFTTKAQASKYTLSNCYIPVQYFQEGLPFKLDSIKRYKNMLFMGTDLVSSADSLTGPGFPIGFPFKFDGQYYDRFGFSSNYYIKLGKSSEGNFTMLNEQAKGSVFQSGHDNLRRNTISTFERTQAEDSLQVLSSLETYYAGTPGNRYIQIEWHGDRIRRAGDPSRIAYLRLYERTGQILMAYNMDSMKYASSSGYLPNIITIPGCLPLTQASVGLRGNQLNNDTSNLNMMKVKKGENTWTTIERGVNITDYCEIENRFLPPKMYAIDYAPSLECPIWFKWTPPFKQEKPRVPFCYFITLNNYYLNANGYHYKPRIDDDKSGNTYSIGFGDPKVTAGGDIVYYCFYADGAKAIPTNMGIPNITGTFPPDVVGKLNWNKALGVDSFDIYFGLTNPPALVAKNVTDTTYSFTSTLAPGTTYYYSVVAKNSMGVSDKRIGSFATADLPLVNCFGIKPFASGDYYDFSFNTLIYKQDPNYKTVLLVPETAYTTSVKRGSTYTYATYVYINRFDEPVGINSFVYIDWNHDGNFSDSTERYTPGNITIPKDAQLGKTYLRTAWQEYSSHTAVNACSNGEQQFIITVLPSDSCSSFELSSQTFRTKCYADSTGQIILNPSGGTAPYTCSWTDGHNSLVRDNLPAGTYLAMVQDARGCDRTTSLLAVQSPFLIQIDTITNGNVLTINVSGGTGSSYTYSWYNTKGEQVNITTSGLPAPGTYTLIITDSVGCSTSYAGIVVPTKSAGITLIKAAERTLKVYPNPTRGGINIVSTGIIHKLVLVDVSGKTVLSKSGIEQVRTSENISSLPTGTYLLKAYTDHGLEINEVIKK